MRKTLAVVALLAVLAVALLTKAQNPVAALVNQANTFTELNVFAGGLLFPGSIVGTTTLQAPATTLAVTYVLPGIPGGTGYALCIGSNPGALAYCAPPGGGGGTATVDQSPTTLNFGSVPNGMMSAPQTVQVANSGTGLLTFAGAPSTFTFTGANAADFSETDTCSDTLDAGWVCSAAIVFAPSTVGSESATLNINDDAASSPQLVTLSGTGT